MEYNLENYIKDRKEIDKERDLKMYELDKKYALANNPYKIGDIITDHIGSLKIEKTKLYRTYSDRLPSLIYFGVELKKDGTPRVRQENRGVHQTNLINNDTK